MNYIKLLWNGDIKLWKTFWLFGVVVTSIFSYLSEWLLIKSITLFIDNLDFILFITISLFVLATLYSIFIWVATWRSSGKYKGFQLWPNTAKALVTISLLFYVYTVLQTFDVFSSNPDENSSSIKSNLTYEENYPFVGFWKGKCTNDFGLAIDKVDNGMYSVSFCGPGGCFEPGEYRPNTTLINDPNYKIIKNDALEVNWLDGFSRYKRCDHK